MKFSRLQGVVCRSSRRTSGFRRRPLATRFGAAQWPFGDRPVHRPFRVGFIPSCLAAFFEVPSLASVDDLEFVQPAGVSSLFAASPGASTHAEVPTSPLRSVLELSRLLDGFLRSSASRASFIPQPRPGFFSVQGFLPYRSPRDSSPLGAPLPSPLARSPPDCSVGCHVRASRLRGLDPRSGAFLSVGV